jgi:hypothetical protein
MRLVYGYKLWFLTDPDHFVDLAEEIAQVTTESSEPGRWLVDSFPWCESTQSAIVAVSFLS